MALISMFLPWWGWTAGPYSYSTSGFGSGWGWLGALLIVGAGVYLAMVRSGSSVPNTSYGPGVIVLGASGIGAILVVLRWISIPRGGTLDVGYGPRFGMIVALVAGVVQVIVAFRLFKQSGEHAPWEANKTTE